MSSLWKHCFQNLPVIFAIGVAIGLARSDKGATGLATNWLLIMNATMNGMLQITDDLAKTTELAQKGQSMVLGIQTIETGVFGGIVTGILTLFT